MKEFIRFITEDLSVVFQIRTHSILHKCHLPQKPCLTSLSKMKHFFLIRVNMKISHLSKNFLKTFLPPTALRTPGRQRVYIFRLNGYWMTKVFVMYIYFIMLYRTGFRVYTNMWVIFPYYFMYPWALFSEALCLLVDIFSLLSLLLYVHVATLITLMSSLICTWKPHRFLLDENKTVVTS